MFGLKIKTDNAAFEDVEFEVARILRETADLIEAGTTSGVIHDINGNKVGVWVLK